MADFLTRNQRYAKPGPYRTELGDKEPAFRQWVQQNRVPFNPDDDASDYDMRGYYAAGATGTSLNANDGKMHFPDTFKTPYHESFSAESQYATPDAPKWNELDQLVLPDGTVVFDERAQRKARAIDSLGKLLEKK